MAFRKIISDEEFAKWAESLKPCRYCARKFYGPVCPCEKPRIDHRTERRSLR